MAARKLAARKMAARKVDVQVIGRVLMQSNVAAEQAQIAPRPLQFVRMVGGMSLSGPVVAEGTEKSRRIFAAFLHSVGVGIIDGMAVLTAVVSQYTQR